MNNINEQIELWRHREYIVSKSNTLIQNSRFNLSVQEQKAIAYILSLIKPNTEIIEYEFSIIHFLNVLGLTHSGKNYKDMKKVLKGLVSNVIWITLPNGTETTINWLSKVYLTKQSGTCKIILDADMLPYLLNLREKFLSYHLYNILCLSSKYSIRLYEILKSYLYIKTKIFKIDELKELLMPVSSSSSKSYSEFKVFNRNILAKSISEINDITDIYIEYTTIKHIRSVVAIEFKIRKKANNEQMITFSKLEKILDNK